MTRSSPSKRSYQRMQQQSKLAKLTEQQHPELKSKKIPNLKTTMSSTSNIDRLVGRDDEYQKLFKLIDQGLSSRTSLTVYISGPAGTGKTLTTTTVIEELQSSPKWKNHFKFISINCMSFQNANDFYSSIMAHFEPRRPKRSATTNNVNTLSSNASNPNLEELKTLINSQSSSSMMTIFVFDEIDQLQTKNQNVLNSIFRLPLQLPDRVILIGIANALDFTSKTMSWLKFGNGNNFHEIRFLPYRKEQIVKIIENRLRELQDENKPLIDRSAVEFCARKIASSSGDIRKALDVCRRACELIDNDSCCSNNNNSRSPKPKTVMSPLRSRENTVNKNEPVTVNLMMNVLNKVYGNAIDKIDSPTTNTTGGARNFLPSDQQVILTAFLVLLKTRSLREIRLSELRETIIKICRRRSISTEGKSESDILNMCQYLSDYGFVKVNTAKRSETSTGTSSPFKPKRTPTKNNKPRLNDGSTTTLSLIIDHTETEQLISSFHRLIVDDASSFL
ncbi:cell division control protein 6 homolog isoform X1 [Dermatophagoides pteronyssinus]|uniref:cell division control protein 6 homolog isoform X1 n=1 Tax=Dermatophagoides pteronyssinus TaxID=6956 RepID=UPI003F666B1D